KGQLLCNGTCIDVSGDLNNCGTCGNACDGLYGTCSAGKCGCLGNLITCGGNNKCTDPLNDPVHCGNCATGCPNSEICINGACKCLPGLTAVGNACVDTNSDPYNCGNTGNICPQATPVCTAGKCNAQQCPNATPDFCQFPNNKFGCVNQSTDPLHCGGCGGGS